VPERDEPPEGGGRSHHHPLDVQNDDVPATYERVAEERFDWAIRKLPSNQRVTFLLKAEGLDHKEIARRLGITAGAVAQRLFNARQTLNRLLQPYAEEGVH